MLQRARPAPDIVLLNKTTLDAGTFAKLPALRLVSVLATGYNIVDTVAAAARGVTVCNVPGYATSSVAQHVFALILEFYSRAGMHAYGRCRALGTDEAHRLARQHRAQRLGQRGGLGRSARQRRDRGRRTGRARSGARQAAIRFACCPTALSRRTWLGWESTRADACSPSRRRTSGHGFPDPPGTSSVSLESGTAGAILETASSLRYCELSRAFGAIRSSNLCISVVGVP